MLKTIIQVGLGSIIYAMSQEVSKPTVPKSQEVSKPTIPKNHRIGKVIDYDFENGTGNIIIINTTNEPQHVPFQESALSESVRQSIQSRRHHKIKQQKSNIGRMRIVLFNLIDRAGHKEAVTIRWAENLTADSKTANTTCIASNVVGKIVEYNFKDNFGRIERTDDTNGTNGNSKSVFFLASGLSDKLKANLFRRKHRNKERTEANIKKMKFIKFNVIVCMGIEMAHSISWIERDVFELKNDIKGNTHFANLLFQDVQVHNYEPKPYKLFDDFNISDELKSNIKRAYIHGVHIHDIEQPMPIQSYGIEPALKGRDIMGCAPTGTGKTWAFLIPIVENLYQQKKNNSLPIRNHAFQIQPSCLILTPTRELVIQINSEANKLMKNMGLTSDFCVGGYPWKEQLSQLKRSKCDILVATPGRLSDFINREYISLENIQYLVIDEADHMLTTEFKEDLETIITENEDMPTIESRQTLMFSATFPETVKEMAKKYLKPKFVRILVGMPGSVNINITQDIMETTSTQDKYNRTFKLVNKIMEKDQKAKILIFSNMKKHSEMIVNTIEDDFGYDAILINSNKDQPDREISIEEFAEGHCNILVATNVAGRGLDIPRVDYVINFDLPRTNAEYVHRVGRCGRAGRPGFAYSFFSHKHDHLLGGHLCRALVQLQRDGVSLQEIPDFLQQYNEMRRR